MNPCWYLTKQQYNYAPYYMNQTHLRQVPAQPVVEKEIFKDYFNLGDTAPDFTLDAVVNGQPAKVSLSDYRGKWVVLFFYGSNFTFV